MITLFTSRESTLQKLAPLKLPPIFNLKSSSGIARTLVDLYFSTSGSHKVQNNMLSLPIFEGALQHWNLSLIIYLKQLALILYP